MHKFGLPASSILNVGISLSNFPHWLLHGSLDSFFFKWPTSPHLQQWTSPVSGSFTCPIALADLDLQWFAKHPPCDIRNIFSKVLCDQSPLVPQFWFLGGHGHLTLSEISFANFVLAIQTVLQPKMFLDFLSWPSCAGSHAITYQWETPLVVISLPFIYFCKCIICQSIQPVSINLYILIFDLPCLT